MSSRLAHTQVWPVFLYLEASAPSTAASRSASSKTMKGALPPSSMEVFFTVFEHCSRRIFPTAVEPPVSTLKTPFGIPARSPSSAIASAEYGVAVAGFKTMVQPAASAGPDLRVIMALGKFHGVIAAHTPT